MKILANVNELTREQWLEQRRKGIGGSDVAAILGLNPYKGPLGVYIDKIEGSSFEGNIHTEFGNWMEPHIRTEFPNRFERFERAKVYAVEYPHVLQHSEMDYLVANIDGLVWHEEDYTITLDNDTAEVLHIKAGDHGILEIKTASEMQWKEWKDDKLPDSYYFQCQHYMSVTGLKYSVIVALVGKRLLWKYIPRNDEVISIMTDRCREFWENHIIPKCPPAPIGLENDTSILKAMYGEESKGKIIELHHFQEDRNRYKDLSKQIKALEQEQEAIKQRIMSEMGDAEVAMIGKNTAKWRMISKSGYTVEPKTYRQFNLY
ncbi:YqaJ viral recombinase family protein [Anaerosolibacter sp.]|uniref:YqaJ viral recombinase family nuclease n=1 Tax=Anaerosolibacter sp. TaxID=1872527 RepID=UPI0039F13B30